MVTTAHRALERACLAPRHYALQEPCVRIWLPRRLTRAGIATPAAAVAIAEALAEPDCQLETLVLERNRITDVGGAPCCSNCQHLIISSQAPALP